MVRGHREKRGGLLLIRGSFLITLQLNEKRKRQPVGNKLTLPKSAWHSAGIFAHPAGKKNTGSRLFLWSKNWSSPIKGWPHSSSRRTARFPGIARPHFVHPAGQTARSSGFRLHPRTPLRPKPGPQPRSATLLPRGSVFAHFRTSFTPIAMDRVLLLPRRASNCSETASYPLDRSIDRW